MIIVYILLIAILLIILFSKTRRHKNKGDKIVQINNDKCARCKSCVSRCQHQVLEMVNGENGRYVSITHPEKCTACGHCVEVCNFDAIQLVNKK